MTKTQVEKVILSNGLTVAKFRQRGRTKICPITDWLRKFKLTVGFEMLIIDSDIARRKRFGIIKPMGTSLKATAFLFTSTEESMGPDIELMVFPPVKKKESALEKFIKWIVRFWNRSEK